MPESTEAPGHLQHTGSNGERHLADIAALLALALLGVLLFRVHLAGMGTFIGDSDRLNTLLNFRVFEVRSLQHHHPIAWNENEFMGFSTYSLPWVFVAMDPLAHLEALFSLESLFRVAGYIACALLILAAWSAYLLIRETCGHVFPAFVGATLYALSIASIARISVDDTTFAVLVLMPIGPLIVRRLRPGNQVRSFIGLVVVTTLILSFTFLQEASYALLFLLSYALYRSLESRRWYPVVTTVAAVCVSTVLSAPRLIMVLTDFRLLARTQTFFTTSPAELFRWLDDGIFGRFPEEAHALHNSLNLHEGLQLYTSTLATLLVLIGMLRVRSGGGRIAAGSLLVVLGWVLSPWICSCGPVAVAGGLLILTYVATGGFGRWTVRGTSPAHADAPFHVFFIAFVVAVVLLEPARYLFYLAFLKVDFTHSRLSIAALLSQCILVSVFLRDAFGTSGRHMAIRSKVMWLVLALMIAAPASWLIDVLSARPLATHLGLTRPLDWGIGYRTAPEELTKIGSAVVVFGLLCGGLWAARRARHLRYGLACCLGLVMVLQAFSYANFQLFGPQTWTFPTPFEENDYFNVAPGILRPPDERTVGALRSRLESDRYRAVLVADARAFPAFVAPHLSQFWNLRVVGGYAPGVPRRLALLPWPAGVLSLRALSFPDTEHLPWPLLSVLNVKYAVIVDPQLYFNIHFSGTTVLSGMRPADLRVLKNPLPVAPREFFAASVRPAKTVPPSPPVGPGVRPPMGLNVSVVSSTTLLLSWVNVTPGALYRIERRDESEGGYAEVGVTGADATSHLNTGLTPGARYSFRVRACRDATCSPYSTKASARTAIPLLTAPQNVTAALMSGSEARLTWTGSSPGATYRIEQKQGADGTYVQIGAASANEHVFIERNLRALTTYYFRVKACALAGCSPDSAEASTFTPSHLDAAELESVLPSDPAEVSIVEGFPGPAQFATDGTIHARYNEDTIKIQVDSSPHQRFLVINELYHPGWRAFAGGKALRIYPTNAVMRGFVVPGGVTEIRLVFAPL